jgi:chromosome segregation ATPase
MDFLQLPGVLPAMVGILIAVGVIMTAFGRRIHANAKARILDMERQLEQVRGENHQTQELLKLLGSQTKATSDLTNTINEQNKILTEQGRQHTEALTMIANTNRASIQLSEKIADLITNFQSFSKEQHAMTRAVVAETSQETTETVHKSIEDGLRDTRADIAGVKKDVQDVKRIVEHLNSCPDELMIKLDKIELRLMSIEQQVPAERSLDSSPPAAELPLPQPEAAETPKSEVSAP